MFFVIDLRKKITRLKYHVYPYFVILRLFRRAKFDGPWILSRCACLGNDVIKLLKGSDLIHGPVINLQKMRVDSFLGAIDDEKCNRGRLGVLSLIPRKDIQICIAMQFDRTFISPSSPPPRFIIMDSFSDLTDVRMRFKADTIFNANISDIAKKHRKNRNLEIGELLSTESLEELYSSLFSKFNFFFPSAPIIFILFPTILDTRLLYRERGEKIVSVLERLKPDFPNLNVVTCPDFLVSFADDDINKEFPYHYEDAVYRNLFDQIKTIIELSEC